MKNFWNCFFTDSADLAEILPRCTSFWRSMSIWDLKEIILVGFLIYSGLGHTALRTTAYLSGDFSRKWWSSCAKRFSACFLKSKIFAEFKLDFICRSIFGIFSDILIIYGYTYLISFLEIFLKKLLLRNHEPSLQGCQQWKNHSWVCSFEASYKRIKPTINHFKKL